MSALLRDLYAHWLRLRGEKAYACRCGKVHRGLYAPNEFMHHNCFHSDMLVWPFNLPVEDKQTVQVLCGQCGMSWGGEMGFDACQPNETVDTGGVP